MDKFPIECEAGTDRGMFSCNVTFYSRDDLPKAIIYAYHEASAKAAKSARSAVAIGGSNRLRQAQWYEAVAATLERVLLLLPGDDDGEKFHGMAAFDIPECPCFEGDT